MRVIIVIMLLSSISACSKSAKERMGIVTSGPDEYQVQRNKPLEVPPHFDLPTLNSDTSATFTAQDKSKTLNESEQALIQQMKK